MPNLRGARLTTTRSTSSNHGRSSLRPLPCLLSELSSSHRCLDASGDSHRAMPPPSSPCPRSTLPDDFDLRLASAATPPPGFASSPWATGDPGSQVARARQRHR